MCGGWHFFSFSDQRDPERVYWRFLPAKSWINDDKRFLLAISGYDTSYLYELLSGNINIKQILYRTHAKPVSICTGISNLGM